MELQQLIGGVKLDELMSQLLEIYAHIEQVLTTRLPRGVWTDPGSKKGARQTLETLLRNMVQASLQNLLPGIGVHWDDQLDIPPVYSSSSVALIDAVDGANEYLREGAEVTSHIGIYGRNGDEVGALQLGIVSYPFHRFRIIAIGGEGGYISYMPLDEDSHDCSTGQKVQAGSITPPRKKMAAEALCVIDRYECYDPSDQLRTSIDGWRARWAREGRYGVFHGSMAKSIVDLVLGIWDVTIFRHEPSSGRDIPQSEYLTPSHILEMAGGVFTDLTGNRPEMDPITGFIAAANQEAYDIFVKKVAPSIRISS